MDGPVGLPGSEGLKVIHISFLWIDVFVGQMCWLVYSPVMCFMLHYVWFNILWREREVRRGHEENKAVLWVINNLLSASRCYSLLDIRHSFSNLIQSISVPKWWVPVFQGEMGMTGPRGYRGPPVRWFNPPILTIDPHGALTSHQMTSAYWVTIMYRAW